MKKRNPHARILRSPLFRMRVVRDKKKYTRKEKHKGGIYAQDAQDTFRT